MSVSVGFEIALLCRCDEMCIRDRVYAVANASGYSVTLSAASMTPQTFAALNTQYGEEIS